MISLTLTLSILMEYMPNKVQKTDNWDAWKEALGLIESRPTTISPMTMEESYNLTNQKGTSSIYSTDVSKHLLYPPRTPEDEMANHPVFELPLMTRSDLYYKESEYKHVNHDYKIEGIGLGLFPDVDVLPSQVITTMEGR